MIHHSAKAKDYADENSSGTGILVGIGPCLPTKSQPTPYQVVPAGADWADYKVLQMVTICASKGLPVIWTT